MGPPGVSRFSTLFYVAAIGGKSPRVFQLCLELYDGQPAASSARIVAKLSRMCMPTCHHHAGGLPRFDRRCLMRASFGRFVSAAWNRAIAFSLSPFFS